MRVHIPGVVLIPEKFKLINEHFEHISTRYRVYADRARLDLLLDQEFEGSAKDSFTYTKELYDDMVIFFTTEIRVLDKRTGIRSWCGESPLTPVMLRKERVASSGIITTPVVSINHITVENKIVVSSSPYIRYEGSVVHKSTDYILDDEVTGEIIYKREEDEDNLYGATIPLNKLSENRMYRLRVRYRDAIGRVSNYGTAFFNGRNELSTMFPFEEVKLEYGRSTLIKASSTDVVPESPIVMSVYKRSVLQEDVVYDSGFRLNTLNYSEGDVLDCVVRYKDYETTFKIFIIALNLEKKVNESFNISGGTTTLTVSGSLPHGTSTSSECSDGYIYEIDNTNKQLVRLRYDRTELSLIVDSNVLVLPDMPYPYRTIIENPLGGLVIISGSEAGVTQNVLFVNTIGGYTIDGSVDIPHSVLSAAFSGSYFIDKRFIKLINKETPSKPNELSVFSIDLLTREIRLESILFDHNYRLANRMPVKLNDDVLLFDTELHKDMDDVASVLKVESDGISLYSTIPNPVFGLPNIAGSVRAFTLANGRPALFILPTTGTNNVGVVEFDTVTLSLVDKRVNVNSTENHRKVYTLRDGKIITAGISLSTSQAVLFY